MDETKKKSLLKTKFSNETDCWWLAEQFFESAQESKKYRQIVKDRHKDKFKAAIAGPTFFEDLLKEFKDDFEKVDTPQAGDGVTLKSLYAKGPDRIANIGVMVDNENFLVFLGREVKEIRTDHPIVKQAILGFYRWKRANGTNGD